MTMIVKMAGMTTGGTSHESMMHPFAVRRECTSLSGADGHNQDIPCDNIINGNGGEALQGTSSVAPRPVGQRRVWPSLALLPNEPTTGPAATLVRSAAVLARSAAVFFGFFISRFDLFCPFAMGISNDAGVLRFVIPNGRTSR